MIEILSYLLLASVALGSPANTRIPAVVEPEYLDNLLNEGKYEEFSKVMGIDYVDLVKPSYEPKKYPMLNEGLEYGDMMPISNPQEEDRQVFDYDKYPGLKWDLGYIPYAITGGGNFTDKDQEALLTGIKEWNKELPCFKLKPRKDEANYLYYFKGNGCWSNVGMRGGPQPLSLGDGCLVTSTVLHETMHATGFAHEHIRTDRDNWVEVLWDNIPKKWWSQFKTMSKDYVLVDQYDYASIMHYPYYAPDVNPPVPAFKILKQMSITTDQMGWIDNFSDIDLNRLKQTYC